MASMISKQKNIERLIARCENILSGKAQFQGKEWKLAKYVAALDDQIKELEKYPSVDSDLLRSFTQRASVLHDVLRNEEQLRASTSVQASSAPSTESSHTLSSSHTLTPSHILPSSHTLTPSHILPSSHGNELLMRAEAKKQSSMRDQLFAKSSDEGGADSMGLRQRGSSGVADSIQGVLERHQKMQDEIAEDMIRMARSLRDNSLIAKDIIIGDNKVLKRVAEVADSNIEGVERETDRLRKHTRGCSLGTWLLLTVVFVVFIAMVLLMRIVPKPPT